MEQAEKMKIIMKILVVAILSVGIMLSGRSAYSQPGQPAPQDLAVLLEKIRNARQTIVYRGEVEVERQFNGNSRKFSKRIFVNPVSRRYNEELLFSPEEMNMMRRMRERLDRGSGGRRGRMMRHWNANFQRVMRNERSFADLSIHFDLLAQNYDIALSAGEEIAGRSTDFIDIAPKYDYRPGNRLWIDEETGLILKREIYARENPDAPVYREEFVTLEYLEADAVPDMPERRRGPANARPSERAQNQRRRGSMDVKEYSTRQDIPQQQLSMIEFPSYLPEGFVLDKIRITKEKNHSTFHQIYTDGIIMFSLFQTNGRRGDQWRRRNIPQASRPGNRMFPAGGSTLYKSGDKFSFVVVGYARRELLQPVLDSLPVK